MNGTVCARAGVEVCSSGGACVVVEGDYEVTHTGVTESTVEIDVRPCVGCATEGASIDQMQLRQGDVVRDRGDAALCDLAQVERNITCGAATGLDVVGNA